MKNNNNEKIMEDIGTLEYTLIESERIIGFNLCGERRICLPQLFRFVLPDFDIIVIDRAVTDLQINCFQCNSHQMNLLHVNRIVPKEVVICGLIRKSDAERLCKYLLQPNKNCDKINEESDLINHKSIDVIHTCFGEQRGTLYPELYTSSSAKCIKCSTCENFFKTFEFVGHTHKLDEVSNTFHWGFDSNNWRLLLQIFSENENANIIELSEAKTMLDRVKTIFYDEELQKINKSNMNFIWRPSRRWKLPNPPKPLFYSLKPSHLNDRPVEYYKKPMNRGLDHLKVDEISHSNYVPNVYLDPQDKNDTYESTIDDDDIEEYEETDEKPSKNPDEIAMNIALQIKREAGPKDPISLGTISAFLNRKDIAASVQSMAASIQAAEKPVKYNCSPVIVAQANTSIPPQFLMLEALWSQLFRDIIQLTHLVQFNTNDERNRLVGQLIRCQELFRSQWTNLAEENQGLKENFLQEQKRRQDMEIIRDKMAISLKELTVENENLTETVRQLEARCERLQSTVNITPENCQTTTGIRNEEFYSGQNMVPTNDNNNTVKNNNNNDVFNLYRMKSKRQFDSSDINVDNSDSSEDTHCGPRRKQVRQLVTVNKNDKLPQQQRTLTSTE